MESKIYIIDGDPIAWARAAPSKYSRMWDTQKQIKFEHGISLRKQHKGNGLFEGPILLDIIFYFKKPKSCVRKQGSFHIYKPDLSNLIKLIEDIGSGILYKDDAIIACIRAQKKYDAQPRTEFRIVSLEEEVCNENEEKKPKGRRKRREKTIEEIRCL